MDALIIEDERVSADVLYQTMNLAKYEHVVCSSSGEQGLSHLRQAPDSIGLVVLDLLLPDADAFQVIKSMAECGYSGAIMLVSGGDARWLRLAKRAAAERGMNVLGAFQKPFSVRLILDALTEMNRAPEIGGDSALRINPLELSRAIVCRELETFYQPQVALDDSRLVGFEALIRWRRNGESVRPDLLVQQAEACGLIDDLTEFVMAEALHMHTLLANADHTCSVSVNVSGISLDDLSFADRICRLLDNQCIEPDRVILEITESQSLVEKNGSLETLSRLGMSGFQLSIDDYGTGFSNLERLGTLAFTELKLDRQFVHNATSHPNGLAILEHCVTLGQELGLSVVAEGIETPQDWGLMRSLGCDTAQGYFIARPMHQEAFARWSTDWASMSSTFH